MGDKLPFPRNSHHSLDFPPEVVDLFCRIFGEHAHVEDIIRNEEAIHESLRRKIFNDGFGECGSNNNSRLNEDSARILQHIDRDLEDLFVNGPSSTGIRDVDMNDNNGGDFSGARTQDDMDLDRMNYKELQKLEEWSGILSKGLPQDLLLKLPSHNYKSGSSSKWEHNSTQNYNKCSICKLNYQEDDILTTLPCGHKYHQHCIYNSLKNNKTCCICKEEVVIS